MAEPSSLTLEDYSAILQRRRWSFLLPAIVVLAASMAVAFGLPSVYRSKATILVEQQDIPADLVQSTVTSYAGERIELVSQRVMTTENLGRIIEQHDLYPELRANFGLPTAVAQMRTDTAREMITAQFSDPRSGRPTSTTIAFSVAFESPSPVLAQKVTEDIASLYLEENLRERTRTAQESTSFLAQESSKLGAEIEALEERISRFKEQYGDRLPEVMRLNLEIMQRTEERLRSTAQEIRTLEEQAIYLSSELAQIDPYAAVYSATGARVMSPADRLKALEAEYVGIASRYSSSHPDRAKLEREMASLRAIVGGGDSRDLRSRLGEQQSELNALRDRYSSEHPDVKRLEREIQATRQRLASGGQQSGGSQVADADNPAYIQIQARLSAADANLASLRRTQAELQDDLKEYERRILESPQIEQEYNRLLRAQVNLVDAYNEINAKLNTARIAETLETESRGERFSLLEPPYVPTTPYRPDRIAILFFGFVLAIGGGVGNLAFREATDQRLYGARALQAMTGEPPLALIPLIMTDEDRKGQRRRILMVGLGVASGLIAILFVIHLFVTPLQELWPGAPEDSADAAYHEIE